MVTNRIYLRQKGMNQVKKSIKFKIIDVILILLMILPLCCAITLTVLTKPVSEGIDVTGAQIYCTFDFPIQDIYITEAQVVSLAVIITILAICLFLTHGIKRDPTLKRQLIAEFLVEKANDFVVSNMGQTFIGFSPFVAAVLGLSALSSLSSLLGLYPPTSDINIVAGWAILVFILITYYKFKGGLLSYFKSFTEPVPFFAPFNVISEIATPVSMAFRHYGNVLSGVVISTLVAAGLSGLSSLLLGNLPGFLSEIPFLRVGIPAILSLYFDIFSGCIQAFIFAVLTMLYISNGFPAEDYEKRRAKKAAKKAGKHIVKS